MLLTIADNKKSGKLLSCDVTTAEEAIKALGLKVSARTLKTLRATGADEIHVIERIVNDAYPNNYTLVVYNDATDSINVCVLETPNSLRVVPKLLIYLSGGLIQWMRSDNLVETLVLDGDVDITDVDSRNVIRWTDIDKKTTSACADHETFQNRQPKFVRRVFKQVLRQLH